MERILGIGGTFLRAKDPQGLAKWYSDNLRVPIEADQVYATLSSADGDQTVWSAFDADADYFPTEQQVMLNYRVRDLDAMLAQLRAAGAVVDDNVMTADYGKFGWATDPEGNRFELWEPLP